MTPRRIASGDYDPLTLEPLARMSTEELIVLSDGAHLEMVSRDYLLGTINILKRFVY